jgi:hypothetical protein
VHDAYDILGIPGPTPSWTIDILEEAESCMQEGPEGPSSSKLRWLPHIMVYDSKDAEWHIGSRSWEAEINWWAQMELLNALVHADQRLGGPGSDKYIKRALQTWELVAARFVSPDTGALYETLDDKPNSPTYFQGQGQGYGPWKASYHSTRALVRSLQALCHGFKPQKSDVAPGA